MKKLLVAGIAAAAFSCAPALAADLPVKAPAYRPTPVALFNWTGFYVGGHVGGGWNSGNVTGNPLPDPVSYGFVEESLPINKGGWVGGLQIGYNWQVAPTFLLGVEADYSWSGIHGSSTFGPIQSIPPGQAYVPGSFATASRNVDWLSSVRGRIGYTMDSVLLYATGGFAWAGVKDSADEVFLTGVTNPGSLNSTRTGWVAGGGFEFAWTNNWLFRAEGLYYNFGSDSFVGARVPALPTFGVRYTDKMSVTVLRVGIDYKFGDWGKAPVVSAKY